MLLERFLTGTARAHAFAAVVAALPRLRSLRLASEYAPVSPAAAVQPVQHWTQSECSGKGSNVGMCHEQTVSTVLKVCGGEGSECGGQHWLGTDGLWLQHLQQLQNYSTV